MAPDRILANPDQGELDDIHPYAGEKNAPLRSIWRLRAWEVPPDRLPDQPPYYWSASPVIEHWGDLARAPNKKTYEIHFCPPPWMVDPDSDELPGIHNVYLALDMQTCYRIWDSFKYKKHLIPLQLLLNDLAQHLAKVESRIQSAAAGEG